jgi:DNA-binding transcriptional LysR family regulator
MPLRGIDANLITALHALLSEQSVTRAAKRVGLGQSSMSHALARLRAHFDDELLAPVGRKLVLTERARSLREPVAAAVAQLERVFAPAERFVASTSQRTFRIASSDNLALYVLPKLMASLKRAAPGVDVRVCALPEDWQGALLRGEFDLKLGRKANVPTLLEQQELSNESFACVVRQGHPVSGKPRLRDYAALQHLLVTPTGGVGVDAVGVVDALLEKQGLRRRIALTVPHFLVAPFVVAQSDLVLTAPWRLLEPFITPLKLRRIALPLRVGGYKLSQVWASRTRGDEAQRWLRAQVANCLSA